MNYPRNYEESLKCFKTYEILVSGDSESVFELLEETMCARFGDRDIIDFIKERYEVHNPEVIDAIYKRLDTDEYSSVETEYVDDVPNQQPPQSIIGIKYFGW